MRINVPVTSPLFLHRLAGFVLAAIIALGLVANLVRFVTKHLPALGVVDVAGILLYTGVCVFLLWLCRRPAPVTSERWIVVFLLAGSLVVKLALVGLLHQVPQTADRLFLAQFIDRWVSGGSAALIAMSHEYYDYPLWAGRAWPILFPLRWLAGESFVMASLLANAVLSTLFCLMVYLVVRPYVRRPLVPLALCVLSPVFTWQVVEYGYQFQGGLLLLGGLWIMHRIQYHHEHRNARPMAGFVALQGGMFYLLYLQQGLELVLLAVSCAMVVYAGLAARSWRRAWVRAVVLVVLPVAVAYPAVRVSADYFARHDEGRLSSHFIGHMAMGWNLVTWGEFYGPVVALDRRTPYEQKDQVMKEYLVEQIRSRPMDALIKLPVIKMIKLFQVGAASGAEENLTAADRQGWLVASRSMRLVYAPVLLGLALVGCVGFFRRNGDAVFAWALLVLAFVSAYTFFSETSPRYSFFFLFVLIACAAEGFDYIVSRSSQPRRARSM
jgi:hypothetical protein